MGKKDKPKKHTESKPPQGRTHGVPAAPLKSKEEVRSSEFGVRSGGALRAIAKFLTGFGCRKGSSQTAPIENQPDEPRTPHSELPTPHSALRTPNSELRTPNSELSPPPKTRFRRLLPDIIKVVLALLAVGLAVALWLKPPLLRDTSPYVSYTFKGQTFTGATLYRPLSVPTRFYVGLPEKLDGRYQWFTIDRRREIAALADGPPADTFLGYPAVWRNAPLGLDLEFRKIDGAEWQVSFLKDAVVFSNNVLSVRLDAKKPNGASQ